MNHFFKSLWIALSFIGHVQSHSIAINYEEISKWCSDINVSVGQLKLIENYLNTTQTFAECSSKDPDYQNTSAGKLLLQQIDTLVEQLLQEESTKIAFEQFTQLVNDELDQKEQESVLANKAEHTYILLSLIITGCLSCIQNKSL